MFPSLQHFPCFYFCYVISSFHQIRPNRKIWKKDDVSSSAHSGIRCHQRKQRPGQWLWRKKWILSDWLSRRYNWKWKEQTQVLNWRKEQTRYSTDMNSPPSISNRTHLRFAVPFFHSLSNLSKLFSQSYLSITIYKDLYLYIADREGSIGCSSSISPNIHLLLIQSFFSYTKDEDSKVAAIRPPCYRF